ncbi:hypothetical protein ZPR_0824 [Zunongwangia profunda SM-A87]|uniref:Uncharacterized protein n=1 Tax=Zunongwangia profunda (strain DSM 18752 / CCTCC AB 206139 / SM-A87) TaxID=655815 RepID=D5BGZ9_ZUNPS|nr:hypothetical protein ZPR_0824 [Zunongwangia profunda SM-A87]
MKQLFSFFFSFFLSLPKPAGEAGWFQGLIKNYEMLNKFRYLSEQQDFINLNNYEDKTSLSENKKDL